MGCDSCPFLWQSYPKVCLTLHEQLSLQKQSIHKYSYLTMIHLKKRLIVISQYRSFLYKYMVKGDKMLVDMKNMFLSSKFCVLDSNVLSRGLITSWDQNLSLSNSFVVVSSLCIEVFYKSLGIPLIFFKIYGPYDDMQSFRDMLLWYQWIKCENLIFDRYLNLTINRREV